MNLKLKDNPNFTFGITQLEYIESSGTQYIDTGFKPNQNTRAIIKFYDSNNGVVVPFGSRIGDGNAQFFLFSGNIRNQSARYGSAEELITYIKNQIQIFDANKNVWSLNNSIVVFNSDITFNSNYNFTLFAFNNGGQYSIYPNIRIYSCLLYDNDILVRDLHPAIDYNGVTCMYDYITKTFFYNQGTGDFVAGSVVKDVTSNIAGKTTTLYHKNCPNVDGYGFLKSIINYSLNNQDEIKYNFYKDSQLWNNIKTTYPNLVPYTDACHNMLNDICTCITPGPIQLASDCNDIINEGFTRLEYIESSGTQYIDTGIIPNINTELECKFIKLNSIDVWFYGCRDSANNNEFTCVLVTGQNTTSFRIGNREINPTQISDNIIHTVKHNKTNVLIDDVSVGTFQSPITFGTTSKTILLFAANVGTSIAKSSAKLYSVKIKDNGTLVREMYPEIDDNGVACMYDYVTEQFFYNQGTGDFVAGPETGSIIPNLGTNVARHITNTTFDDTIVYPFERVRVDIGNVSGSLAELMQYSTLNGFNDNYEAQTKPRLCGTYTITDTITQAQLDEANAAFDTTTGGLTIIANNIS